MPPVPAGGKHTQMDIRRFYYVVSPRGERGPFSVEDLNEELGAGRIAATQQVRTGMGTMLGSVREVIDAPESMWKTAETGSGMSPVANAQRHNRIMALVIIGLMLVPALALIAFFGIGTAKIPTSAATEATRSNAPLPSSPNKSLPSTVAAPNKSSISAPTVRTVPVPPQNIKTTTNNPVVSDALDPSTRASEGNGPVRQATDGKLLLTASTATITTKGARLTGKGSPAPYISGWNDEAGGVEWNAEIKQAGSFLVTITYACNHSGAGSQLSFNVDNQSVTDLTIDTGSWDDYQPHELRQPLIISKTGMLKFTLVALKKKSAAFMKLRQVVLTPVR